MRGRVSSSCRSLRPSTLPRSVRPSLGAIPRFSICSARPISRIDASRAISFSRMSIRHEFSRRREFSTSATSAPPSNEQEPSSSPPRKEDENHDNDDDDVFYYDAILGPLDPKDPEDGIIIEEIKTKGKPSRPYVTLDRYLERVRTGALNPDASKEMIGAYTYVCLYVPFNMCPLAIRTMAARAEGKFNESLQLEKEFNTKGKELKNPNFLLRFGRFITHTWNTRERHRLLTELLRQDDLCDPAKHQKHLEDMLTLSPEETLEEKAKKAKEDADLTKKHVDDSLNKW